METDRDLLFGLLALQLELVDLPSVLAACGDRRGGSLADRLRALGILDERGAAEVGRLLDRKLARRGGDATLAIAEGDERLKRALADALSGDGGRAGGESPGDAVHPFASTLSFDEDPAARLDLDLPAGCHCGGGIDRYRLIRLHARGGIGRIWLTRDALLGRDVARKELRPEKSGSRTARARLLEEARITGQLQHPGVVPVYEMVRGTEDEPPFYTMRFVKGRTLSEAARAYHRKRERGEADRVDLLDLLNAFVTVCHTVAYAHSRGVIHRDLKGPNVILGNYGEAVLLDWGLAKLVDDQEGEPESAPVVLDPPESRDETLQGKALGTPAYIPPEQAAGQLDRIDRRSDVYGLGAILYEILTGRPPFNQPESDAEELLRQARHERPKPPRQVCRSVPRRLEAICLRALERDQDDRYQSAAELAREVQRWLADEPVLAYRESIATRLGRLARRRETAVAASGLLLLALVAVLVGIDVQSGLAEQRHRQGLQRALDTLDRMTTTAGFLPRSPVAGGRPVELRQLEAAASLYRELRREFPGDPEILRRAERATRSYVEALRRARRLGGTRSGSSEVGAVPRPPDGSEAVGAD